MAALSQCWLTSNKVNHDFPKFEYTTKKSIVIVMILILRSAVDSSMFIDLVSRPKFEIAALSKDNKVEVSDANDDENSFQTNQNSFSKLN
jgi:hypothetical protein